MRLLTIAVPAYNTRNYIQRCLDSLLYNAQIAKQLDIIVVNDGSSDDTAELVQSYIKQYPKNIRLINKENGGHGSAVNCGLREAQGKYFRVVDSDDWVNIDDFREYVNALAEYDEDILITNYQQDFLYDSSIVKHIFSKKIGAAEPIESVDESIEDENIFFKFSMHSMTVKTSALRKVWGDGLPEKTFYVDQIFVAKALDMARNYRLLPYDIYRYFIGRPEQSVSGGGFFRHRLDHERVLKWLLKEMAAAQKPYLQKILQKQVELMVTTQYEVYYTEYNASQEEIDELLRLDAFLQKEYPEIQSILGAARNLQWRLAPWRRKIKRSFLGDKI